MPKPQVDILLTYNELHPNCYSRMTILTDKVTSDYIKGFFPKETRYLKDDFFEILENIPNIELANYVMIPFCRGPLLPCIDEHYVFSSKYADIPDRYNYLDIAWNNKLKNFYGVDIHCDDTDCSCYL